LASFRRTPTQLNSNYSATGHPVNDEMEKTFEFWRRWLLIVSLVIVAFGLVLAAFNQTAIFDIVFNDRVNPAFWQSAKVGPSVVGFQQWIYGVLGATVAGWGIVMAFIAHGPFVRKEKWAWQALAAGLALWYLTDTAVSAYFEVWINVAFNTALLAALGLPLIATKRAFH
jgi:hypothetical protein